MPLWPFLAQLDGDLPVLWGEQLLSSGGFVEPLAKSVESEEDTAHRSLAYVRWFGHCFLAR